MPLAIGAVYQLILNYQLGRVLKKNHNLVSTSFLYQYWSFIYESD